MVCVFVVSFLLVTLGSRVSVRSGQVARSVPGGLGAVELSPQSSSGHGFQNNKGTTWRKASLSSPLQVCRLREKAVPSGAARERVSEALIYHWGGGRYSFIQTLVPR